MKKIITGLCAAVLLAGCTTQTPDNTPTPEPTNAAGVTFGTGFSKPTIAPDVTVTPVVTSEPSVSYDLAPYTALLGELIQSMRDGTLIEGDHTGIEETIYGSGDEAYHYLGYQVMDIDGDEVPELLIGLMPDTLDYMENILEIYELFNGMPLRLYDGWMRNSYYLLANGYKANFGSNGAMNSVIRVIDENDDAIYMLERDGDSYWEYNQLDSEFGDDVNYDEDRFWQIYDDTAAMIIQIPAIRFEDYDGTLASIPYQTANDDAEIVIYADGQLPYLPVAQTTLTAGEYTEPVIIMPLFNGGYFQLYDLEFVELDQLSAPIYQGYPAMEESIAVSLGQPIYADIELETNFAVVGAVVTSYTGTQHVYAFHASGMDGSPYLVELE